MAKHTLKSYHLEWQPTIVEKAKRATVRQIKEALRIHEDKNGRVTFDRGKGIELSAMWLDLVKIPWSAYRLLKMRRVTFNTSI